MPRNNGTGPTGNGPGTGWGQGPCGGGMAQGRGGARRAQGLGRGRFAPRPTKEEETEILEEDLNTIKSRLAQLKNKK